MRFKLRVLGMLGLQKYFNPGRMRSLSAKKAKQ